MTRALLGGNRIVLMDEATANIDQNTESLIQEIIKSKFRDSTIIMIAHRLNTILHCDKVMVLEAGQLVEYGDV